MDFFYSTLQSKIDEGVAKDNDTESLTLSIDYDVIVDVDSFFPSIRASLLS